LNEFSAECVNVVRTEFEAERDGSAILNENDLAAWCQRLNLNERARKIIDQVRSSEPTRRIGGGRSNVSGLYPSRKMGRMIQFESHRVELAAVYEMEHDPLTLEFYAQPPSIMLDYTSANDRRLVVRHAPDFFVLRQDSAGWEEWKTEEDLNRLAQASPNRYRQESGCWRCPPGEAYAAQWEIHWRCQRLFSFSRTIYVLMWAPSPPRPEHGFSFAYVLGQPATLFADLLQDTARFTTADDIYLLIAAGHVYVDFCAERLTDPPAVRVFPDRAAALDSKTVSALPPVVNSPFQTLHATATVTWDGRAWKVANVGDSKIALLAEDGTVLELSEAAIESLLREGRIRQSDADREHDACKNVLRRYVTPSIPVSATNSS
jgi:putative transposase